MFHQMVHQQQPHRLESDVPPRSDEDDITILVTNSPARGTGALRSKRLHRPLMITDIKCRFESSSLLLLHLWIICDEEITLSPISVVGKYQRRALIVNTVVVETRESFQSPRIIHLAYLHPIPAWDLIAYPQAHRLASERTFDPPSLGSSVSTPTPLSAGRSLNVRIFYW